MTLPFDRTLASIAPRDGGPLRIGEHDASVLAERFGTPLYVFDAGVLRARVAAVARALGPRVRLLWSVKANPSVAVTRCLRLAGCGAEIASLGELEVALAAGHAGAALRFAGPGKTDHELATALGAGVCFHVESPDEVDALTRLAAARRVVARVAVRVNQAEELHGSRLRMGGASSRFGVDEDQVEALLRTIAASPSLRLDGVHAYGGTQCFDAAAFVHHARRLAGLVRGWETACGVALREIDVGGGFGVPTYLGDPSFDLDAAAAGLGEVIREHDRDDRTWFVELGRFLAAPAGVYLASVVRTKTSGGRAHAVLDGGLHQHAAAAGIGTVLRRAPWLVPVDAPTRVGAPVTLGGPLCTPADQFADQLPIGPLLPGDVVAALHAGAYGLSYSPHSFLGHPTPAEVLVDGADARVVRDRGTPADARRGQHV